MNTSEKKKWSRWRQNNFEFFEKNLKNIRHNDIVVDIGCGEGQFKAFFNNVKKYIGIDFQEFPGVTTLITDLTKPIPLESDLADIVFISNVLEHIPTPEALIAEAHRLLKDDGMIIGTVPYIRDVHQAPYDFLRYTHFMLEKMFTDAGFKDIEITPIGTPFDVYQVVQDIFCKVNGSYQRRYATAIGKEINISSYQIVHSHIKNMSLTQRFCRRIRV